MRAETRLQHDSRVRLQDLSGLTEVVSGGIESYSIWMKDYRTEHASTTVLRSNRLSSYDQNLQDRWVVDVFLLLPYRSLGVSESLRAH
jgi:hypothetical protein